MRNGELRRTTDAGRSWTVIGHTPRLVSLAFASSQRGFALSEHQRLLQTADGGRSWTLLRSFHVGFGGWGSIDFSDGRDGWVALSDRLFRTRNGGLTWRRVDAPCSRLMLYVGGVSFLDARRGFLVCGGQPATIMQAKEVYESTDGGTSWKLRACVRFVRGSGCPGVIGADGHASGLDFRDDRVGLLVTDRGGIARTHDAGRRWRNTLFTDDEDEVMATSWASDTTVYALLYHGAKIVRSDDGGRHWKPV
jgi:photosystem II stability/assembly factor-like uncharacterized protein